MRGRTLRTRWTKTFLASLRECGIVRTACQAANVGRRTVYDLREQDEAFRAAWDESLEDACDSLESEARRRAVEGWDQPVFGSGGEGAGTVQVGVIRKYDSGLMIALLKAHRPSKFRDNVHHTGDSQAAQVQVNVYIPSNGREAAAA